MENQDFATQDVIEEVIENEVIEEVEATEQESTDELEQFDEVEEEEQHSDKVPLSKYMQERKKRQELEAQIKQSQQQQQYNQDWWATYNSYVANGWPEAEAQRMTNKDLYQKQESEKVNEKLLEFEIKDLAKSDSFYADAVSFKEEIKEKVRKLGISVEDAYMMVHGKSRVSEYKTQQEQLKLHDRRPQKKVANAAPSAPKNPYPLDEHDRKALAELKKAQPGRGWDEKKYYELMKKE